MKKYTYNNAKYIIYVNHPKKTLWGDLQQAKGDCLDRVHSDQMVLRTVRCGAGPHERWLKAYKLS
jgi:hypothetical protein